MRKKKESDLHSTENKTNKNYNSIMKIHEDKMNEFSKAFTTKKLKELNTQINKNLHAIEATNKELALNRINNRYFSNNSSDMKLKISKLELEITKIKTEIEYIQSGKKESDYILGTCTLIQAFLELEDKEKELIMKSDEINIEQELFNLNYKKNNIIDDYMKFTNINYTSNRNVNCNTDDIFCKNCNDYLNVTDGFAVCYTCGNTEIVIQQSEDLSYKEMQEIDYRPQFTYQKETHLEDWLRRFQAKEHKEIPQEILDKVILEAHKQRIKDLSTLTELQVKKFLKKLELNDYYDNVISIINRINKRPPFILTTEIEVKIKEMFQKIQSPFEKYKDPNRKNMLSYSYLLHHFFLILGLPQFSKYFFLLKSPEKLRQQDQTFKKIVDELAKTDPKTPWRFFPSL